MMSAVPAAAGVTRRPAAPMSRHLTVDGASLAYLDQGAGEPIVFVHGGLVADAFAPVLAHPALAGRYRLIAYHRRGYGMSTRAAGALTTAQQAADCLAVMRALGIERAHLAGYSYGGSIALQLALDAPQAVHSLALLEPLIPAALSDPATAQFFLDTVGAAYAKYAEGDKAGAIDTFARGAFGPSYRQGLEQALPGAFEQMVADADVLFQVELPALQQWGFAWEEALRLGRPLLSAFHDDPIWSGFRQTHEALRTWLPDAVTLLLPTRSHLLQLIAPHEAAEGLGAFFARHPLPIRPRG
ncbi:MAG TPA: alpha/beta hydrolase [Chloroflexota bacterium]|nr:alpha/beta hydrolase [Chloroflexota bacterium]